MTKYHPYLRRVSQQMYDKVPDISGTGHLALWAECGNTVTITLHQTMEDALKAKKAIDAGGCGGQCRYHRDPDNLHGIEDLTIE